MEREKDSDKDSFHKSMCFVSEVRTKKIHRVSMRKVKRSSLRSVVVAKGILGLIQHLTETNAFILITIRKRFLRHLHKEMTKLALEKCLK